MSKPEPAKGRVPQVVEFVDRRRQAGGGEDAPGAMGFQDDDARADAVEQFPRQLRRDHRARRGFENQGRGISGA